MTDQRQSNAYNEEILRFTSQIVSAYVAHHSVPSHQISELIVMVHSSIDGLAAEKPGITATTKKPAVAIKKSITPDYIICLEDGKKLKMLKRYLRSNYNLSPEDYKVKWSLPGDYPMVAPNYAKRRSEFAKQIGLGRKGRGAKR